MVICADLNIAKPESTKKCITYRKYHKINNESLSNDLESSELITNPDMSSCSSLYTQYIIPLLFRYWTNMLHCKPNMRVDLLPNGSHRRYLMPSVTNAVTNAFGANQIPLLTGPNIVDK